MNAQFEVLEHSLQGLGLAKFFGREVSPEPHERLLHDVLGLVERAELRGAIVTRPPAVRALLGEGWDARRITGLVDLTAVTTSTAVVQTRGRALRTIVGGRTVWALEQR